MKPIDYWRLSDELTIVQAAILICECDPSDYRPQDYGSPMPDGYDATRHALLSAVASKRLEARPHYERDQHGDSEIIEDLAQIPVTKIKDWLAEKGFKEHSFFFPLDPEDEFLSPEHPRYSAKLAAAVTAWRELDDPALIKGTPKQALQKWLRLNAVNYGLCDEDGKPTESAIVDISKIANWSTKGGAPSTPSASSSGKPNTGSPRKPRGSDSLRQKTRQSSDPNKKNDFDLDDEIPF